MSPSGSVTSVHIYMPIRKCFLIHGDEKQGNFFSFSLLEKKTKKTQVKVNCPNCTAAKTINTFQTITWGKTHLSYVFYKDFTKCSVKMCVHFTVVRSIITVLHLKTKQMSSLSHLCTCPYFEMMACPPFEFIPVPVASSTLTSNLKQWVSF